VDRYARLWMRLRHKPMFVVLNFSTTLSGVLASLGDADGRDALPPR